MTSVFNTADIQPITVSGEHEENLKPHHTHYKITLRGTAATVAFKPVGCDDFDVFADPADANIADGSSAVFPVGPSRALKISPDSAADYSFTVVSW